MFYCYQLQQCINAINTLYLKKVLSLRLEVQSPGQLDNAYHSATSSGAKKFASDAYVPEFTLEIVCVFIVEALAKYLK